ncbi:MAG: cofC [Frankiales bacterium]|nr:cofC [Frankiales bacterium]
MKPAAQAKTRLRGATSADANHEQLVRAIQQDTLAAVLGARAVHAPIAGIHVIAGQLPWPAPFPPDVELVGDAGGGLNAAITAAALLVRQAHPDDGLLAMVADLPALRPAELRQLLLDADGIARAVVIDAAGSGTTMLLAAPGVDLDPQFGLDSARRHQQSGAIALPAEPGLRQDVDTADDLRRCLRLGVGERTAAMIAHLV